MRPLPLLLVLVAGVAGAQQATMNCRSGATNCAAHRFQAFAAAGEFVLSNGINNWGIWTNATDGQMNFSLGGGTTALQIISGTGVVAANNFPIQSQSNSGNNAFIAATTGAWWDLGAGANDRIKSDGTNVVVDTGLMPNSTDSVDVGSSSAYWKTFYSSRGIRLNEGDTVKWTTAPISDNTTATGQLVYNNAALEPVFATSARKYNGVGLGKDWVVEKRTMVADIGFESTTCPTANPGLRGTGAGALTYACTDAAAATNVVITSGNLANSFRQSNTTAAGSSVSIVDVSAASTELRYGPKLEQRISIPSGSTANVRIWIALVPTATSLSGVDTGAISVIGFRFSTAVPDSVWQACSGDAASVACTSTGVTPTTGTDDVFEIDCREATACRFLINGSLVATRSSTLPAGSTQLGQRVLVQTTNATAKGLGFGRQALLTN